MITTVSGAVSLLHATSLASFSLAWQQDSINSGNSKLLEVFVGVAAVCLLLQLCVVAAVAYGAMQAKKEILGHVTELKVKLLPLIDKSHGLVTSLTPEIKEITAKVNEITGKVNVITGHVGEIVVVAKEKVNEFSPTISQAHLSFQEALGKAKTTFADANDTVMQANEKARDQVERVNGMVSSALDATVKLGKAIEHAIGAPGREISGLVGGAKSSIDSLMKKSGSYSNLLVGKVATMFAKNATKPKARTAPSPTSTPVARYSSMASPMLTGVDLDEPGVPSGSRGNGDPIVG